MSFVKPSTRFVFSLSLCFVLSVRFDSQTTLLTSCMHLSVFLTTNNLFQKTVYASANNRRRRHYVYQSSVLPLTPISRDAQYLFTSWRNFIETSTDIRHISGHCLKGFHCQMSKVKVILIIVCELFYYNLYSYSLEGAISR